MRLHLELKTTLQTRFDQTLAGQTIFKEEFQDLDAVRRRVRQGALVLRDQRGGPTTTLLLKGNLTVPKLLPLARRVRLYGGVTV